LQTSLNDTEPNFGVTCPHGVNECRGNIHQLCAAQHLDQKRWWAFVQCQNFNGRSKVGREDVAFKCADTANFDWKESGVADCAGEDASGKVDEGIQLLKESVQHSDDLGIEYVFYG
jgi:hypothetical protein